MVEMTYFPDHSVLKHRPLVEPVVQIRLYDIFKKYPYMLLSVAILLLYVALVRYLRFGNVNSLKAKYGFSDDPRSYEHMTVEQAQEVERNLAEWDFPFLFEFGWIIEFLRVCGQSISERILLAFLRNPFMGFVDLRPLFNRWSNSLVSFLFFQGVGSRRNSFSMLPFQGLSWSDTFSFHASYWDNAFRHMLAHTRFRAC